MTIPLLTTCLSVIVTTAALVALLLDRSARARAWRRIAEERRWNRERRHGGS